MVYDPSNFGMGAFYVADNGTIDLASRNLTTLGDITGALANVSGFDYDDDVTNITVVKGIVTAAENAT